MIAPSIRAVLVGDDPLALAGLAALIADQPGSEVVGELPLEFPAEDALALYQPDVVILDMGWEGDPRSLPPGSRKMDPLDRYVEAGIPLVVLLPDRTWVAEALAAGARGLLPRQTDGASLSAAALAVTRGLTAIEPSFLSVVPGSGGYADGVQVEELTPREHEVLRLMADGLPNKTIAYRLEISEHTVKFHVNAIFRKLGVQSRTQAVVRATRLGVVPL